MKTITISLYNRPDYTQQLFDALDNCFNIQDYIIWIFCEPTNSTVIEMAKNYRKSQTSVFVNAKKLGCNHNIYQCLSYAFSKNDDFHIHFEDDTIPGKDAIVFLEWAKENFRHEDNVFSATAYNRVQSNPSFNANEYSKRKWFSPWIWGTWKHKWDKYSILLKNKITTGEYCGWDTALMYLIEEDFEVFPVISRSQNIGCNQGTHVPSARWHRENQHVPFWIESLENQYCSSFVFNSDIFSEKNYKQSSPHIDWNRNQENFKNLNRNRIIPYVLRKKGL